MFQIQCDRSLKVGGSVKHYFNFGSPYFTEGELKDRIRDKWAEISTNSIISTRNKALRQWKTRLEAVVKEDGGHIEHLF